MTVRTATLLRLKPECVEAYIAFHRHVWPELEAVYHAAGMTDVCCYISGTTLVVTIEVDPEIYGTARDVLAQDPVDKAWQSEMAKLRDPEFLPVVLDEVYRLPEAIEVN